MAGLANQGYLLYLPLGLDLLLQTVCTAFKIPSLSSVQNLGSRDPCLMKLALDQAMTSMNSSLVNHASEKMLYFFNLPKLRLGWVKRAV